MDTQIGKKYKKDSRHHSSFAFGIISFMHDNPLLPYLIDAPRLLKDAGLKPGDKVLEVGCGPGFFTIPAAEIVGDNGVLYAVDVHPRAIERVRKKIEEKGISNVRPLLTNASETGLADGSIDVAFMFGLPYIVGGQVKVLAEMHRTLKPGGILSYKKTRGSEKGLIEDMKKGGMIYFGKKGRILLFKKAGD
jgi:ubiquinone/menaquinone biosynthesis C-methylase UbiE